MTDLLFIQIRVLDPRRETNYFFDGVFGPEASNYEVCRQTTNKQINSISVLILRTILIQLYLKVGRPLVYAALNGYKGTLLTYGQTGTGKELNQSVKHSKHQKLIGSFCCEGKTYTLLSDDGVTTNVVGHCFERIQDDAIHSYKVWTSRASCDQHYYITNMQYIDFSDHVLVSSSLPGKGLRST